MSKKIELIQSLSQGIILAATVSIGSVFLVILCYQMYHGYMESQSPTRLDYQYEQLRVLSDGRPLIEVRTYRPQFRSEYLDIDRNPVQLPDEPEWPKWLEGANLSERHRVFPDIIRRGLQARIRSVVEGLHGTEDWYFVFEDKREGHGYFVAFDFRDRERLGYLGTQGFRNDPLSKMEQFAVDGLEIANDYGAFFINYKGSAFLQSGNKLFLINLEARTVRLLLGDKDVLTISTVQKPGSSRN